MAEFCFTCRFCHGRIHADEKLIGQVGACPRCEKTFLIPQAAGETACPACQQRVKYSPELIGDSFVCPSCKSDIRVSIGEAALTATPPDASSTSTLAPAQPAERGGDKAPRYSLFGKKGWYLVNCLTGEGRLIDKFPFEIGSGTAVDWRLEGIAPAYCAFLSTKDHGVCLAKNEAGGKLLVNGQAADEITPLELDADYAILIGSHCFALHGGKNAESWRDQINLRRWVVTDGQTNQQQGPVSVDEIPDLAASNLYPHRTIAMPQGMSVGFTLTQLTEAIALLLNQAATKAADAEALAEVKTAGDAAGGKATAMVCPVCWLRFEKGDVMHVAVHETLRGDPLLGEDAPLRFHATRFNDQGQAVDAMGMACLDIACPHCRRKLPVEFLEVPHHIFSIVGAPSAGKSYYLSVLVKTLPRILYNQFGVVFKDGDPAGNALLNIMKNRLFSGGTPEQLYLDKTALEGTMYEKVLRHGRAVSLPKPFVFSLSSKNATNDRCGIIFYDNAGEHFEPGLDEANSPGAQHVAAASTVFFLFDPTANPEFRRRLSGHHDPQLQISQRLDQQDVILAEMGVRIKRLLHLPGGQKAASPLVVLVGKSDVWLHLIEKDLLKKPLGDGSLDLAAIRANSQVVRELLLGICPEVVANAETLAREVIYFPVSSFGHSPVKLADGRIAPDPNKLNPQDIELPVLWALSRVVPGLIKVTGQ